MSGLFDDQTVTRGSFTCPWCNEPNDAAFSPHRPEATPKPGDVGICATCAKPMVYQEFGKPRRPTEGEWANINDDDQVNALRRAIFMERASEGKVHHEIFETRGE